MDTTQGRVHVLKEAWRRTEQFVLGLCIIGITLAILANVFAREVVGKTLAFTQEIGSLLLIIITFGGLSYAAELRRHINLSAVHDLLPVRTRRRLTRVINAVTAVLMLGVTYIGGRYVVQIYSSGDVTSVLEIPMYLPLLVLPVGFFLTALRYLSALKAGGQEAVAAAPEESSESARAQE